MSYLKDGYEIVDLGITARSTVLGARDELASMLGAPLEEYKGDDLMLHGQAAELAAFWVRDVIASELYYFRDLLGRDIHMQRRPFLRISRPGVVTDNIGLHRDTWYGDTPYEISVWIPFTDTDEGNALRVAPGSHVWSETEHPVERFAGSVEKGSLKHSLGFIHGNPKRLAAPVESVPLPVRVGQMIVFPLSLLHGVEVNQSTRTRVSMDIRLANSLAPIRLQRSRDENYYEELCVSPATAVARRYYAANECKSTTTS